MVVPILVILWAAVLIPPLLRSRAESRPADSIGAFRRQLAVLQRTGPSPSVAPVIAPATRLRPSRPVVPPVSSARRRTQKRRRDVFVALLAGMLTSLLLGMFPGLHLLLIVHVLMDLAFAAYVAMLVKVRNVAAERDMKVRFLPGGGTPVEPALALRRSAR